MAERTSHSQEPQDDFDLESLSRPRTLGDRVRVEVEKSPTLSLVGELLFLQPEPHGRFRSVHDFFVEPKYPPSTTPIDHEEVALLQASVWKPELRPEKGVDALHDFADKYNEVLRTATNVRDFPDIDIYESPFIVTSSFRDARVTFGAIRLDEPYPMGKTTVTSESTFLTPELKEQAEQLGLGAPIVQEVATFGEVRIRLFPPLFGDVVHRYEKGYYQVGDVEKLDGRTGTLVWGGKYVSFDSISPHQLSAMAQGEFPFPELKYLPTSVYNCDPEEARKIRRDRLFIKTSHEDFVAGFAQIAHRMKPL